MSDVRSLELRHTRVVLRTSETAVLGAPKILVLGGRPASPSWLRGLRKAVSGGEVWALDRGADVCMAAGVRPDRLIGDLDSVSRAAYDWACAAGAIVDRYPADKNLTDFQLALELLEGPAVVTGCWGGRFDHAFSLLFSALRAAEWDVRVLAFADERELLCPLWGSERLRLEFTAEPQALSLLPLTTRCEGVNVEGVKWPLEDMVLEQSLPWAVSNVPASGFVAENAGVSVDLKQGVLGIYAVFEESWDEETLFFSDRFL